MFTSQGFSLTEVLITLCVILSTMFGLLTQQWQTLRLFNEATTQWINLLENINKAELQLAGMNSHRLILDGERR